MSVYRVTPIGGVGGEIKALAKDAAVIGMNQAYLDAWMAIEKRLSSEPNEFGERCYSLLNGDLSCHIGAIHPVAIRFAVHEKTHNVYVLKAFLLGS